MTARETELLDQLRKHPHFAAVIGNIVCDLLDGLDDSEEYEGESEERRECYQLLHEVLTGIRFESSVQEVEPDEDDDPGLDARSDIAAVLLGKEARRP